MDDYSERLCSCFLTKKKKIFTLMMILVCHAQMFTCYSTRNILERSYRDDVCFYDCVCRKHTWNCFWICRGISAILKLFCPHLYSHLGQVHTPNILMLAREYFSFYLRKTQALCSPMCFWARYKKGIALTRDSKANITFVKYFSLVLF